MKVFTSAMNVIRIVWSYVKAISVCRALKIGFLMLLLLYTLTAIVGFIQGLILVQWYTSTLEEHSRFFLNNLMESKIMGHFVDPFDSWDNVAPVFHVPQIQSPLKWTSQLGLVRPAGWGSQNVEALASLSNLYWKTRPGEKEPAWHHWIYLSAQQEPWRQPDGPVLHDPWDKAFVDLLEYRGKHDVMGRSNFHYVSCPKNFLCASWRATAPALLHFTNEGNTSSVSDEQPEMPDHIPVDVRVFELPLAEIPIPGIFPSYFEQMRSLTASNTTFWTTKDTYSHFWQTLGQTSTVLKEVSKTYPWTYGLLARAEAKWTHFWGIDKTLLRGIAFFLPFASSAIPLYFVKFELARWHLSQEPSALEPEDKSQDPLAQTMQSILDMISDEEKEKFRNKGHYGRILELAESGLEKDEWYSKEEVIQELFDAMGLDEDGKMKKLSNDTP
ncbi:hypothetical protein FBEOM_3923 [Fusarium beomiforme]|uniref:Uncharacterized protein n=1 Tax=Fusarium beomiforme TaxID=44412 RepID=A0A9P5AP30_9HYPO|nr:hypothetical protein FBEOM_3923 [Fusarium beomiforme]